MKTSLLTALFAFLIHQGFAQVDSTNSDTTKIKIGDMKVLMIDENPDDSTDVDFDDDDSDSESKEALTHWGGLDLGVNMLLNKDGNTTFDGDQEWLQLDPMSSLSWNFNLIEGKIRFVKDYVGLIVGAGFQYNSYGFKNNVNVISDADTTYGMIIPDSIVDYTKNKLRVSYINVPLILEFNTSSDNDRSVHLGVGAIGGLRMGAITKNRYEADNKEHKDRVKTDYNLSDWKLDLTARIGYRNVTLFATYGLIELFDKKDGPEVYSMTAGISLIPF
jgi:Outer membrane protein beta-barrel domain